MGIRLLTSGGGGVNIQPASSIATDVTLTVPVTGGEIPLKDGSGTITATSFVGDGSGLTGIAGGFSNMQVFTSSGTFTVPTGITKAKVTVIGGGGGGSNGTPTNGGTGGTSSFGAYCSATGGTGNWNPGAVGNAGGSGSGGDLNLEGSRGFAVGQRGLSFYGLSYGGGGQGSTSGGSFGGGGGGGGAIELVTGLTPGGTVSVTVGAGGTAASGAGAGTAGVVIVEY